MEQSSLVWNAAFTVWKWNGKIENDCTMDPQIYSLKFLNNNFYKME